jgi:hypothetical protein
MGEDLMEPKLEVELNLENPPVNPFAKNYDILDDQSDDDIDYQILELSVDPSENFEEK